MEFILVTTHQENSGSFAWRTLLYDQCLQKNLVVGVCWGINLAEVRCCWHFCKCVNTVRNMESRNENSMVLFAVQSFINVSVCIKINKLVFQIYFRFENTV